MRYLLLTCIAITVILLAFRPISGFDAKGFVRDEKSGTPLSNASVRIKGANTTVQTRSDGSFSIFISGESAELVFYAVGYLQEEIKLTNDGKPLQIRLRKEQKERDEKVVTGYETGKQEDEQSRVLLSPPAVSNQRIRSSGSGKVSGIALSRRVPKPGSVTDRKNDQPFRSDTGDFNTEAYDEIVENRFLTVPDNPLSTFSIDVDGASYSNVRRYLKMGQLPPEGAVRIEELINYFHYDYPQPQGEDPFSINTEMGECPWSPQHRLVVIGLQGKKISTENLPASNLVFLIDVSGSMMEPEKLPLVQASMKLLVDQLREKDRVALVVYAGNAGLVMPSTSGGEKQHIKDAIDQLEAGGSTAGGAGIQLAYKVARENFMAGANNRVILCTDGDFNVGASSDSELERMIAKESQSGIFLTVLGYGMGNYKDSKMQKLADKGNGNHAYIDNLGEAKKVLVNEFGGTLFTIAKDVKLQVEFNPAKVQAYRLIGYENRMLNKDDFNNDRKDAGELGSGHTVTALYEIIPVGVRNDFIEKTDPLKYQQKSGIARLTQVEEMMTIKFRYKKPDASLSKLLEHPVLDQQLKISQTSANFRFVAAVAQFGLLLRDSEFKQKASYAKARSLAGSALGKDEEGYRSEFLGLLTDAGRLAKKQDKTPVERADVGIR
jgi:Ca-activated chloride channel family protein